MLIRLWPLALQDTVSVNRNLVFPRFVFLDIFFHRWILVTDPSLHLVAPLCTAAHSPAQISDRDVLNPVCHKERVRFYTACYVPNKFKLRALTINRYFCETFSCQCHLGILSLHWKLSQLTQNSPRNIFWNFYRRQIVSYLCQKSNKICGSATLTKFHRRQIISYFCQKCK